jgi:hypothetical protein
MKPIRPIIAIPIAVTFTTDLNSSIEGFFVSLKTLFDWIKKLFNLENKLLFPSCSILKRTGFKRFIKIIIRLLEELYYPLLL